MLAPVLWRACCQCQWEVFNDTVRGLFTPFSTEKFPSLQYSCAHGNQPVRFPLNSLWLVIASWWPTQLKTQHSALITLHMQSIALISYQPEATELRNSLRHRDAQATQLLWQSCSSRGWAEFLLPGEQSSAEAVELLSTQPQPTVAGEGCPTTCGTRSTRNHAACLQGRYLTALTHLL